MQAEVALAQQLKRSFKTIKKNLSVWDQVIQECRPYADSINNLADQLECCQRMKLHTTPLKNFDDVQERLIGKLIAALEEEMCKLILIQKQLQDISGRLSKENDKCVSLYQHQRKRLPVNMMVEGMPFRPSYASMLQTIEDVDRTTHELVCTRSYFLDQLNYNKPESIQDAMNLVKKNDSLMDKMEESFTMLQYFLDDDFSTETEMPVVQ